MERFWLEPEESVILLNTETGEKMGMISNVNKGGPVGSLAFSPDGKKLAIGVIGPEHHPSYVRIWDFEAKKEVLNFVCHEAPFTHLAWSPNGQTLATASRDHTVKLWDIEAMLKKAENMEI